MKKGMVFLVVVLTSLQGIAQVLNPLTIGEVYNFEIGDTFIHSTRWEDLYPVKYTQRVITDKTIFGSGDSITYKSECYDQTVYLGPCCPSFNHYFISSKYENLMDTITNHIDHSNPHGASDTLITQVDTTYLTDGKRYTSSRLNFYPSNCNATYTYGEGLGNTYSFWICPVDAGEHRLEYYHKVNGEQGGVPYTVSTDLNEITQNIVVGLFPMPVSETFQLQLSHFPPESTYFILCDVLGREIKRDWVVSATTTISRKNLNSGTYFWQVAAKGKILDRGKIVFE